MKPIIHDITDPKGFLPEPTPLWQTWWFLLVVAVGVILLAVIVYFIFRKKPERKRQKTLLDRARERLHNLKSEAQDLPHATIAVRISLILRQYLEAAFDDPALFETDQEFTLRPHALEMLPENSRRAVTTHLKNLSHLKYAPGQENEHATELIDEAGNVLANIELNVSASDATMLTS
ncbi:MAG: DUF4381 family protein [Verrucomicrobiae bacterium]|nr:DUF4381 family protein [Verrucomicrobiae bacterium]NNJ85917.1 DUF4381 family protein [Akkermansiaceae bacterium]